MTNLVEKVLLIGFGILMIFSFFSIINPLIITFNKTNDYQKDFEKIIINIDQIDKGINYVAKNNDTYSNKIFIFKNLKISIDKFSVDYVFLLDGIKRITKYYDIKLESQEFNLISGAVYSFFITPNSNNSYIINFSI
jgi:hypothetical protein